jgi:hypothetical protein
MNALTKTMFSAAVAVTGATLFAGAASAAAIGVQFVGSQNSPLLPTDSAGLASVAQTNWNALTGASFAGVALQDGNGAPTTASLGGGANGTYFGGHGSPLPAGNVKLTSGELFNGWPGAPRMTVSNIPYAAYDVYVYANIDASGLNETVSITPAGGTAQSFSFVTMGGGSAWTLATSTWDGSGTAPALTSADCAHFTGLTGSAFTMDWGAPGNGGLNGFQIVEVTVPEPASLGMLAAGGLLLLGRGRTRKA